MKCRAETMLIHVLSGLPPCEKEAVYVAKGALQPGVELCEEHAERLRRVDAVELEPIGVVAS